MTTAVASNEMARKTAQTPPEPEPTIRVTIVNLKGSASEREYISGLSRRTGVSVSEIVRRGIALWAVKRKEATPPEDWIEA